MPFKSDAQRRWAHTPNGIRALGGKKKVNEWDQASEGMNLPSELEDQAKEARRLALKNIARRGR